MILIRCIFLGKYYLVDFGYPTPLGYLGPYRCERYYLSDFRRVAGFHNHNEVFNYFYFSLRSTIERTFGVWKNRFAIIRHMPNFKYTTQVQIVCATMAIHNFIRRNSALDIEFHRAEKYDNTIAEDLNNDGNLNIGFNIDLNSSAKMDYVRDRIRDEIMAAESKN